MDEQTKMQYEARFKEGREEALKALEGKGPVFHMVSLNQMPRAWVIMYGSTDDNGYHLTIVVEGVAKDDRLYKDGEKAFAKLAQMGGIAYAEEEEVKLMIVDLPPMDERQKALSDALLKAAAEAGPAAEA